MAELPRYYTPPQVARSRGVDAEKVRDWIRSGELKAVNVAKRATGRPRWRISPEALADFDRLRSAPPRPPARRSRIQADAVKEWV